MKTVSKVGIVVWSIVALLLVSVMIAGICAGPEFLINRLVFFSGSALNEENTEVLSEYSVATEDINGIKVDWKSGLIKIATYDGKDIQLTERVLKNSINSDKMTYEVEAGELVVNCNSKRKWHFFGFGYEQKVIDVKIPENNTELLKSIFVDAESADIFINGLEIESLNTDVTSGNVNVDEVKVDSCNISATSGNITVGDVGAYTSKNNTLQLDSTSGNIELNDCNVKDIQTSTTSGNVECDNITAGGSVQIACTSGNIKISNIDTNDLDLGTTSGNVTVDGKMYNVNIDATSGEVTVNTTVLPEKAILSTTSGDMKLYIPDDKDGFTATYSLGSGELDTDLDIMTNQKNEKLTYGNGKYSYSFESISGNIVINSNSDVN